MKWRSNYREAPAVSNYDKDTLGSSVSEIFYPFPPIDA
jgi:hypothetical protein